MFFFPEWLGGRKTRRPPALRKGKKLLAFLMYHMYVRHFVVVRLCVCADAHDGQEQAHGGPPAPADQLRDVHGRQGQVPKGRAEVSFDEIDISKVSIIDISKFRYI